MLNTLLIYVKKIENGRTIFTEEEISFNVNEITPIYIEDDKLVITTTEGKVAFDKESIVNVTLDDLERNGFGNLDVIPLGIGSDILLDRDNFRLFDLNGIQLRVRAK